MVMLQSRPPGTISLLPKPSTSTDVTTVPSAASRVASERPDANIITFINCSPTAAAATASAVVPVNTSGSTRLIRVSAGSAVPPLAGADTALEDGADTDQETDTDPDFDKPPKRRPSTDEPTREMFVEINRVDDESGRERLINPPLATSANSTDFPSNVRSDFATISNTDSHVTAPVLTLPSDPLTLSSSAHDRSSIAANQSSRDVVIQASSNNSGTV